MSTKGRKINDGPHSTPQEGTLKHAWQCREGNLSGSDGGQRKILDAAALLEE